MENAVIQYAISYSKVDILFLPTLPYNEANISRTINTMC